MNISQNAQPIKVYISFAQKDQGYKDELLKHLNSLQTITTWSRADLIAGDNVKDKIKQNISTANIAILLASPDYWASDSINDSEFPQILERYNKGKIKVVPINIRPNTPYKTAISELEVLPKGGKPISSWRDKDKAWASVVKDLSQILNNLRGEQTHQGKQDDVSYSNFQPILDEIASELAFNYYQVSFGDTEKGVEHQKIFSDKGNSLFNNEKKRNILIVGAGAIHASCPYIPFGKQLRTYLEEKYPVYRSLIKKRGYDNYNNNNAHFNPEEYLAELTIKDSKINTPDLTDIIHEMHNRRFLPTHIYEFIAHLLKHRFIDIVININFDELLDKAIEEEFGKSQYIKVLDESNCESIDNIMIDGRLKIPLYIKIHGTASNKSSLKFTKEKYLEIPKEVELFLEKWISGKMKDDCKEEDCIPANIFCLGFDIRRANFYNIFLKDKLKEGSKLFLINWKKELGEDFELDNYYIYNSEGKKCVRHIKLEEWSKIEYEGKNKYIPPMADFFYCLWNDHLLKLFNDLYKPRSLARHEIVCNVFYNAFEHGNHTTYEKATPKEIDEKNSELANYFRSTKYYFERTILEIAIAIVKNKGLIEPREVIKEERIGQFYGLYKKKFLEDIENQSPKKQKLEDLSKLEAPKYCSQLYPLNDIYKDCFKMEERYGFSKDLLSLGQFSYNDEWDRDTDYLLLRDLKCAVDSSKNSIESFLRSAENEHILVLYRMSKYLLKNKGVAFFNLQEKCKRDKDFKTHFLKRLCSNFNILRTGFTYDITPKFLDEGLYYFNSVKRRNILHTNLSLSYQFLNTLYSVNEWNTLLLISERGKFIVNHLTDKNPSDKNSHIKEELKKKQIIIIACHEAVTEYLNQGESITSKLIEQYMNENNLKSTNTAIHFLPYWMHNHHMAIFLKIGEKKTQGQDRRAKFEIDEKTSAVVVKSMYYYKQGFSNKINPFILQTNSNSEDESKLIQNDQELLINIFLAYYIKAQVYEINNNFLPKIKPDSSFKASVSDDSGNIIEYEMNKEKFLKELKDQIFKKRN